MFMTMVQVMDPLVEIGMEAMLFRLVPSTQGS